MNLHFRIIFIIASLEALLVKADSSSGSGSSSSSASGSATDPYVPTYTECPKDLGIRNASDGLSGEEKTWRRERAREVQSSLETYLETANISGLDVKDYIEKLDVKNVPIVGLTISGGGTQSGIGGLGIWQALDSRYARAVDAGTGGLAQVISYVTGLSGGGAVTVSLLAANDFGTVSDIEQTTNFSSSYDDPSYKQGEMQFENAGAKLEAGFPISVTDVFGQFWATWLPEDWAYASYSDIARNDSAFRSGKVPMPIITLAEVVPGVSPKIGKIMYPGNNQTNAFNLTSYEVTPFEFGSWLGGRVQGFMPTQYLGTAMSQGKVQNKSECVVGFDKLSFIQGSTTDAFCAWFIDDFYNVPVFAKRDESGPSSPSSSSDVDDIPIPEDQYQSPLVQLVNETAANFGLTFNQSMWSTYPNPFEGYNEDMKDVSELLIVDGSLGGENNPIRPLIVPARGVDFIIVYEASSEGKYSWMNGTSLQNTARAASEGDIPFPKIPNVNTMIAQNFTSQPTFFGCNASDETPLVLYLPNSPWSGYSNFTYRQASFTTEQLNATLENAFQLATYGDGQFDTDWPACLACATIRASLSRVGVDTPEQCTQCFDRHCWDGKESENGITEADLDLKPRLDPELSFQEWNSSVWGGKGKKQSGGNTTMEEDSPGGAPSKLGSSTFTFSAAVMLAAFFFAM